MDFFLFSAIDLLYGGIYCFMCQDYIYDKDMEQIAKEEQRKAWKLQGMTFLNRHKLYYTLAKFYECYSKYCTSLSRS